MAIFNSTTNSWGGAWSAYGGVSPSTENPSPFVMSAATDANGYTEPYCANMYGTASSAGLPSLSTFLNSGDTGVNISQYTGVQFWFKGDGGQYQIQMHATVEGAGYGDQYYAWTPATTWIQYTVPFSSFTVPAWSTPTYVGSQAVTSVMYVTWLPLTAGSYNFQRGHRSNSLSCPGPPSTATPTFTSTFTNSPTISPTPTFTSTGTFATSTLIFHAHHYSHSTRAGLIQPGMKICFIGDSITYRGNYVHQVENSLSQHHLSQLQPVLCERGGRGWTATQFLQYTGSEPTGLDYVINTVKPNIATICFGMNDASYTQESTTYLNQYETSMTSIITQLQAAGIKVVLLSNGLVDQTVPYAANTANIPADYDTNTTYGLPAYANWVMNYGAANNIPAFNVLNMATTVYAAARAAHTGLPYYTDQPQDGIHPNPSGGLIYAYGLLTALGVPTQNRTITLNGGSLSGSTGAVVGPWMSIGDGGSFTLTANPMPYVQNSQALKILSFMPFQQTFNNIMFTATGLTGANYYIVVDGFQSSRSVSSSALSSGVNLLDYWCHTTPTSPSQVHTIQLVDTTTVASACYNTLIDDMQSSNNFPQIAPLGGNIPWPVNLWGGLWFAGPSNPSDTITSSPNPFIMSAPGYSGQTYAANLSGTSNVSTDLQILDCYCYTQYDDPKNGIQFWFNGTAGKTFRCQVHIEAEDAGLYPGRTTTSYDDNGTTFTATGSWQLVSLPYSAMTQAWAASGTDVYTFNPNQIENIEMVSRIYGQLQHEHREPRFLLRLSRAHAHTQQHPRRYYAHEDRNAHAFLDRHQYGYQHAHEHRDKFLHQHLYEYRDQHGYRVFQLYADEYLHGHDHQHTY